MSFASPYTKTVSRIAFLMAFAFAVPSFAITVGFEDFATGDVDGVGGWHDFGGTQPNLVTTEQARTGSQSLKQSLNPAESDGYGSDVYHDLPMVHSTGTWDLSYWVFVPSDFNGASIFHLSEATVESAILSGDDLDFGIQLVVDGSDTFNEVLVSQDGETGVGVPLIRNQWVEVAASINLDANTVTATYNGSSLFSGTWDPNPVDGSDVPTIGGFNMWVQGVTLAGDGASGSIYFDDISLVPEPSSGLMGLLALGSVAALCRRRRK